MRVVRGCGFGRVLGLIRTEPKQCPIFKSSAPSFVITTSTERSSVCVRLDLQGFFILLLVLLLLPLVREFTIMVQTLHELPSLMMQKQPKGTCSKWIRNSVRS